MIAGGVLLSTWGGFNRRVVTVMLGIIGMGVGVVMIGLAPAQSFWMALAGMAVMGVTNPLANGPLHAILQATVKPEMQGRVMSLTSSAATAMTPLSLAVAGPLSDLVGIRAWYLFGGAVCLLMGMAGFLTPAIMKVESNHTQAAGTEPLSAG